MKATSTLMCNVVTKEKLRGVQSETLKVMAEQLKNSFGPMGSNTCIKHENALNMYTKDGHTILKNLNFRGVIEQSIKDDVESITRHIVKTVGDGTTSAVILSSKIFEIICKMEEETGKAPAVILKEFENAVKMISTSIKAKAKECTAEDIYDIALISTNNNHEIAKMLKDIYVENGMSVFIDVSASLSGDTVLKMYDGMTINTGFADPTYVTNTQKNEAVVDHPRVYFFEDPIDTKEMAVYLDAILAKNIFKPLHQQQMSEIIPTVVVAPRVSRDLSAILDQILAYDGQLPASNKLPFLMISDYHQPDIVLDICKLCDGKTIKKYIDPNILQADIDAGNAPTPDTIQDWCGYCDQVVANSAKTSFINPAMYRNDDGTNTTLYDNMLNFYKSQLKIAEENGEDAKITGNLKRHIHSLESNMVELFIGGITQADRDALRDLVEDAVKNCRSAAENGVGYGANFMALQACDEIVKKLKNDKNIYSDIFQCYYELSEILYSTALNKEETGSAITGGLGLGRPYNISTKAFDGKVKSSIESDMIILDAVAKIIGLMATCNQFIVPTPMHNVYEAE